MTVLQQAREFLSRVVDWDGSSYVNIHYFNQKAGQDRRFMWGAAVQTVDEAIQRLIYLASNPEAKDIYFCTSTQATCEEKQVGKRLLKTAVRNRDQAVKLKALFLDIDVGKEGGYATTAEAVAALKKFILDTQLPAPTAIVASGTGGFHVYWIMESPLEVTPWQQLADAMVAAAKASGLLFDSQCTVDAVRILRIPQTRNFKTNPPSPVTLKSLQASDIPNEVIENALLPFLQAVPDFVATAAPSAHALQEGDEFAAGIETGAAPRDINEVAAHCAWIRETLENGGKDNNNPLWFLSLRLALFCAAPDETGHALSNGHHGYHPDETQQELDRLRAERARNSRIGFPSCRGIQQVGAVQCLTCPLLQENKSPLNAAKPLPAQVTAGLPSTVVNPYLPAGYRLDALGRVVQDETDEKGRVKTTVVFQFIMNDPCVVSHGKENWVLQFKTVRSGGVTEMILIPLAETYSKDSLGRVFSRNWLNTRVTDKVLDFFMSFLQKLRESRDAVSDVRPYGWCWSNDDQARFLGFSYAGRVYSKEGEKAAPESSPTITSIFRPAGAAAHWIEAAKLITEQKRPALDCIIAAAFAAPLVRLLDLQGVCIGGVSRESGIGKTTTMNIAAAVWGDPLRSKQGNTDTDNSVFAKVGKIANLPIFWDELKTAADTDKFISMMFQLTSGREKSRANKNADMRDQETFATMLTYASNESLYDPMLRRTTGTDAGHLRMFEFVVPPIPEGQKNNMLSVMEGKLHQNYGHAGAAYAAYLGANYQDTLELVQDVRKKWEKLVDAQPEERFWVGACTALVVGAKISNHLGLTSFDEAGLRKFLYQEFMAKRLKRAETPNDLSKPEAVASILGDFLAEKAREYTLVTNQILLTRGRPGTGDIQVLSNPDRLRIVEVQYGRANGVLRISDMALGQWCRTKGFPKGSLTGALHDVFGARVTHARLGSGTPFADPVTRMVHQITIPGSGLEDLVEYPVEESNNAQSDNLEPVPV